MKAAAAVANILKTEGTEYLFCFPVNALIDEAARVGTVDAREDLDEGRLARAVLADEAVHLAGEELDVAALEGVDGAEALLRTLEGEHRILMGRRHLRKHSWAMGAPRRAAPP